MNRLDRMAGEHAADMPSLGAWKHCAELVKLMDRDRYVATLFAPADRRNALFALYAFGLDVARIRELVSEALPGEMRLQWWRDALTGNAHGEVASHPLASALLMTIADNNLPVKPLLDMLDARSFDLYDDAMPDWNALEGYCGETQSILFRLATIILARGQDPGGAEAAGHAGVAFALTGLLRALPWHARRGQIFLPDTLMRKHHVPRESIIAGHVSPGLDKALAEVRAEARHHLVEFKRCASPLNPVSAPAFWPIATIEAYLCQMERADYEPFLSFIDVPQWQRIWSVWRMSRMH